MIRLSRRRLAAGLAAPLLALPHRARADAPLRLVFPFAAGGAADGLLRMMAEQLRPALGRPVVVENRPGAGGRTGARSVVMAPPDGTTLLFGPAVLVTLHPHLFRSLGYDPAADLAPVIQAFTFENALAVGPGVPAHDLAGLAAWYRANPAHGAFGTPGVGTGPHFIGTEFARRAGLALDHAPYAGVPPALPDLAGGHLPAFIANLAELRPHHAAGRLRLLATAGRQRNAAMPDLATFRDQGFDVVAPSWFAFYAPSATPAAAIARLSTALAAVLQGPDLRQRAATLGFTVSGADAASLRAIQAADLALWGAMVRASGFQAEEG